MGFKFVDGHIDTAFVSFNKRIYNSEGTTLLRRIPIRVNMLTLTFAANAEIQRPTGTIAKNSEIILLLLLQ